MPLSSNPPVALAVAGLDPSGGAGLLLDVRILAELGVYPAGVATAITEQDSVAVHTVWPVEPARVRAAIEGVLADLPVAAIKIGMLGSAAVARAVAEALFAVRAPIVVDPVLRSSSGASLLDDPGALDGLLARAALVTPNLDEAAALGGVAGLRSRGARALLVKGGHAADDSPPGEVVDRLHLQDPVVRVVELSGPRLPGGEVHGTGCALSSAIAARLAMGAPLEEAVRGARDFVRQKIATAAPLGHGRRLML